MRFELLKEDAHIGQQIGEAFGRWGLHTVELGQSERGTPWGLAPTTVYEIALPKDKPPSPQSHYGELADPAEKARRRRLGIR